MYQQVFEANEDDRFICRYLSAGEARKFANEHPDIVVKPVVKCKGGFVPTNDMTYGIKSK
jgi:hypothetical protein